MIALFSTAVDESTTDVLRWIRYLSPGADVVRVNADEPERVGDLRVTNDDVRVELDDRNWSLDGLSSVWYRKGRNWLCNLFPAVASQLEPGLRRHLEAKVRSEEQRLAELVHGRVAERAWTLCHPERGDLNKLVVLAVAEKCGLDVPRFLVTTSKRDLGGAVAEAEQVTKALSDGVYFFDHVGTRGYYSYTEVLAEENVEGLPATFAPSLVQTRVAKTLDLRIFFLEGHCYSMAIFSQADERTQVDFRRYNEERPNRTVPYQMPAAVETRLCMLFSELGLNTGSADMILDDQGRYVFLEINPHGQFSMVSSPCNYHLERAIASALLLHE